MARYLRDPDSVGGGWLVYDYVPKELSPLPPRDGLNGWGLYIEEGVSRKWLLLCVIGVLSIALLTRSLGGGEDKALAIGVNVSYVGVIVGAIMAKF
jgi:hypothetical protein